MSAIEGVSVGGGCQLDGMLVGVCVSTWPCQFMGVSAGGLGTQDSWTHRTRDREQLDTQDRLHKTAEYTGERTEQLDTQDRKHKQLDTGQGT